MAGMFPFYILREWDNSGKLLVGGKLHFYESGTLVPKATYTTYLLNTQNPNPVVLDAGGAADIWLGEGAYRVLVTDANDVQIRSPIDGVMGMGGGALDASSNAVLAILDTYGDVRTLTTVPDVCYVTGRLVEGDGGAGLFQLQPGSIETDDDGVVLVATAGTHVYKRVFDGVIDPRWYGVAYASVGNMAPYVAAAALGSVRHRSRVDAKGVITLTTNLTIPDHASFYFDEQSFFVAGSAVTVTFQDGSKLASSGICFGNNVTPIIGLDVVDTLKLSWMGGSSYDARWAKFIGACSGPQAILGDFTLDVIGNVIVPANLALDFAEGVQLGISGLANIDIGSLAYKGNAQIIAYANPSYIGTVSLGGVAARPEWFGAVGDNTTLDTDPFHAAALTGKVWMEKQYKIAGTSSYPSLVMSGPAQPPITDAWLGGGLTVTGSLTADWCSATAIKLYVDVGASLAGTDFRADSSDLINAFGGGSVVFSGTAYMSMCRTQYFLPTTPVLREIDCADGATLDAVRTTKLSPGLNQAGWFSASKHPAPSAALAITLDDPSVIFLSGSDSMYTVSDPVASPQKTGYFKIIHGGNPLFLYSVNGHFRIGSTVQTVVRLGGGTSNKCMALELFANPAYPGEWSVVFAPNF